MYNFDGKGFFIGKCAASKRIVPLNQFKKQEAPWDNARWEAVNSSRFYSALQDQCRVGPKNLRGRRRLLGRGAREFPPTYVTTSSIFLTHHSTLNHCPTCVQPSCRFHILSKIFFSDDVCGGRTLWPVKLNGCRALFRSTLFSAFLGLFAIRHTAAGKLIRPEIILSPIHTSARQREKLPERKSPHYPHGQCGFEVE